MQLRKRGTKWYLRGTFDGERLEVCTGFEDKKAAEAWAKQWERDRADPDGAARRAARAITVQQAVDALHAHHLAEARAGNLTTDTVAYYLRKLGHLVDVFGGDTPLADVDALRVDEYIATRRSQHATKTTTTSEHTIAKELYVLRVALKHAKRRGWWAGDVEVVVPEFAPRYEPRERCLTPAEVWRVIEAFKHAPDRQAWVALAAGVGAELSALQSAQRGDWDRDRRVVRVRGSKNDRRDREVPVVLTECRALVTLAFKQGQGLDGALLAPWEKNWQGLQRAAARAGIEPFSLHSLRHSFGSWHLAAGISWDDTARAMGHADTTMLHRIYGHLTADQLRNRLHAQLAPPLPQHSVRAGQTEQPVHASEMAKAPADRGFQECRRADLNRRPWDYDSPDTANVIPLKTKALPRIEAPRVFPFAPPLPQKRRGRSSG